MEGDQHDFIKKKQLELETNESLKTINDKLNILDKIIEMDSKKKKMGEADINKRKNYVLKMRKIGKHMENAFKEKDKCKHN
jgi:hypothetical protein